MMQKLYDEHYVDSVGTINAAKTCMLDMDEVGRRYNDCQDQGALWDWQQWVYAECRKAVPGFVDYLSMKSRLIALEGWTEQLQNDLDKAMCDGTLGKPMQKWARKAEKATEAACKACKAKYG